jgi:hypothetical protein
VSSVILPMTVSVKVRVSVAGNIGPAGTSVNERVS